MTKKEMKDKAIRREMVLLKYQLASDFVKQLSIVYEKSAHLFYLTVRQDVFSRAVREAEYFKDKFINEDY